MAKQRSLKHEYELYVEREIEEFKDSVPRSTLLTLGDEAVAGLGATPQVPLTEMVVWEEVDRIIARRIKLPTYATWRRRRLRRLTEFRKPERWGLSPDGAVANALRAAAGEHVLLAGTRVEDTTLFSAALGCAVTVLTPEPESLERVLAAADHAGVGSQVRGCVCELGAWAPDVPLRVVLCTPDALDVLAEDEREVAITALRRATTVGGVHLLHGAATHASSVTFEVWRALYAGWAVLAEQERATERTYIARRVTSLEVP